MNDNYLRYSVVWICVIFVNRVATSPFVIREANLAEEGKFVEGDILPDPEGSSRNLVRGESELWPNNVFPYEISDSFNEIQKFNIETAIDDLSSLTCVKFKKRKNESTWASFENIPNVCASVVGYKQLPNGGPIPIYVGVPGCEMRGQIQHEILHSLGFWHEHTRPDRDDYINVLWDNVKGGSVANFESKSWTDTQTFGLPYDVKSVMHYRSKAFSKNNNPTIVAINGDTREMGQRFRISKLDIAKLNRLYDCGNRYYKGYDLNVDV